jgi:hypothetical protein
LQLGPLPEYNNAHGPIPDVQKDLLMFLWHIGMHHLFIEYKHTSHFYTPERTYYRIPSVCPSVCQSVNISFRSKFSWLVLMGMIFDIWSVA